MSSLVSKVTKTLPSLLREESSLLSSLVNMLLSFSNEEFEASEFDPGVSLHVDRLIDLFFDVVEMASETVGFSVDKQQLYVSRVCESLESLSEQIALEDGLEDEDSDYNLEVEKNLSYMISLADSLERVIRAEMKMLEGVKGSVKSAMEDYKKAWKAGGEGKIATRRINPISPSQERLRRSPVFRDVERQVGNLSRQKLQILGKVLGFDPSNLDDAKDVLARAYVNNFGSVRNFPELVDMLLVS